MRTSAPALPGKARGTRSRSRVYAPSFHGPQVFPKVSAQYRYQALRIEHAQKDEDVAHKFTIGDLIDRSHGVFVGGIHETAEQVRALFFLLGLTPALDHLEHVSLFERLRYMTEKCDEADVHPTRRKRGILARASC